MKPAAMLLSTFRFPTEPIRAGYVVIDPSNGDTETFEEQLPVLVCTPAGLDQSQPVMPRLIDVGALSVSQQDALHKALLREIAGHRPPVLCALLECARDAPSVARHLARFLVGPGESGDPVLWRYFDPRVFALAMTILSTEQCEALLGPVIKWSFPWCQRWWSVSGPGQELDPLLGLAPAWPSTKQWARLEHSAMIAGVMGRLQDSADVTMPLTDATCLRVQNVLDVSTQYGAQRLNLAAKDDLADYAWHCVRYGQEFKRHPKLEAIWIDLAEKRIAWHDFIAVLTCADYQLLDTYSPWHAN